MARIRGPAQSTTGFSGKIRDIVAEKGTAAAAKKFGRSEGTIRSWAKGMSAPNRYDDVIQKVNHSYTGQKQHWTPEKHKQKIEKTYGTPETARTGSIIDYMKVLESNGLHLSRPAKAWFLDQYEQGNVVSWTGQLYMPVSDVRFIPAMSDPYAKITGGAKAFGLTHEYFTGEKGKRKEKVRGIVTQTINRSVYKVWPGGLHKYPSDMTPAQMHTETKRIHLEAKVNAARLPAIYLGYGED